MFSIVVAGRKRHRLHSLWHASDLPGAFLVGGSERQGRVVSLVELHLAIPNPRSIASMRIG
jgi:hypothetical protein